MGTNGRTGRKRRRKKNGNYNREYGVAIHDPEYISLLKWGKRNGICFGKLRPANFPQIGRGLMTPKKLRSGDLVISVPERMLITSKTAEQSEIGKKLVGHIHGLRLNPVLSAKQMLCIFILHEKYRGRSSFWYPYISTLPKSFNTPAYFQEEELQLLPSDLQKDCAVQISAVTESYEQLKGCLDKHNTVVEKEYLDFLTFDEFRWAWFVVNTRSVFKEDNMGTASGEHVQMEDVYALAPVLDLLNHTDTAEIQAGFNHKGNRYEIHTLTAYNKGLQVFINYGPHDNRKLLTEYGFILPKNLHNTVTFSSDLLYSVTVTEMPGISKRKRDVILVNQLDKDLFCSEENGISWRMLVLLRILAMDEDNFKQEWQKLFTGEKLSEKVESRVFRWMQCLIKRVLESYEQTYKYDLSNCLENCSDLPVNMQLALQLRNQEKEILSNVLNMVTFSQETSYAEEKGRESFDGD